MGAPPGESWSCGDGTCFPRPHRRWSRFLPTPTHGGCATLPAYPLVRTRYPPPHVVVTCGRRTVTTHRRVATPPHAPQYAPPHCHPSAPCRSACCGMRRPLPTADDSGPLNTGAAEATASAAPSTFAPAASYSPRQLPTKYHRRWRGARPCSGWERVDPLRHGHRNTPAACAATGAEDATGTPGGMPPCRGCSRGRAAASLPEQPGGDDQGLDRFVPVS